MSTPALTIEAQKLSKVFDAGQPNEVRAVSELDLRVKPGDIVLIMGPSGSGKTTLVTLLGGLARPSSGQVNVSGQTLEAMPDGQLTRFRRSHIGFVFQSFHLLKSLTALENVELVYRLVGRPSSESRSATRTLLERLGLGRRLSAFPKQLSGGEKQRVSIARALANDPKIVFADEPTANLDSKTGHDVMKLLCGIACQELRTVVIVSHDDRLRDMAQRILRMEDGHIVSEERGGHTTWCQMPHANP